MFSGFVIALYSFGYALAVARQNIARTASRSVPPNSLHARVPGHFLTEPNDGEIERGADFPRRFDSIE